MNKQTIKKAMLAVLLSPPVFAALLWLEARTGRETILTKAIYWLESR
jgi:hypothetical protein